MPQRRHSAAGLLVACVVAATAVARPVPAQTPPSLRAWVDVALHGRAAEAPSSWLDGGFGRLVVGTPGGGGDESALAAADLGFEWEGGETPLLAHLHARGRAEETSGGQPAGLVEAWLQGTIPLRGGADHLRLRGGQQFLPTSRENVGPLWSSPYTVTL
jgi:hypothetical protein